MIKQEEALGLTRISFVMFVTFFLSSKILAINLCLLHLQSILLESYMCKNMPQPALPLHQSAPSYPTHHLLPALFKASKPAQPPHFHPEDGNCNFC
jgi:hypothetical protein